MFYPAAEMCQSSGSDVRHGYDLCTVNDIRTGQKMAKDTICEYFH